LLESKRICLQDVRHIYIKHAKCCVTKLMAGIAHSHHSNNSRAKCFKVWYIGLY